MSCGCSKKTALATSMALDSKQLLDKNEWGPILWKYLHCLVEKIGTSGSTILDTDQANYMETVIHTLPLIIPCTECQAHATSYLAENPLPPLKGLYGTALQSAIRQWLFSFHNTVRSLTGKPIIIPTIEDCQILYNGCTVTKTEYTMFVQSVASAVRQGLVRIDNWRKWYNNSERLRIITGNVVA
jgi:hypothetical protein